MNSALRFLALGDSYTIGEGLPTSSTWPYLLANSLKQLQFDADDPQVVARTGWTCRELLDAMEGEAFQPSYDFVTVLIGVNNQYRGHDVVAFTEELAELLSWATKLTGERPERLLVISIPDYGVTPFAREKGPERIASELDIYNLELQRQSHILGAEFVDITTISRTVADQPEMLADDGLHPAEPQYALWAQELLPVVARVIQ